jgi:hypothetical protein
MPKIHNFQNSGFQKVGYQKPKNLPIWDLDFCKNAKTQKFLKPPKSTSENPRNLPIFGEALFAKIDTFWTKSDKNGHQKHKKPPNWISKCKNPQNPQKPTSENTRNLPIFGETLFAKVDTFWTKSDKTVTKNTRNLPIGFQK